MYIFSQNSVVVQSLGLSAFTALGPGSIPGQGTGISFIFGGSPKSLQMVIAGMKLKEACSLEEKL